MNKREENENTLIRADFSIKMKVEKKWRQKVRILKQFLLRDIC